MDGEFIFYGILVILFCIGYVCWWTFTNLGWEYFVGGVALYALGALFTAALTTVRMKRNPSEWSSGGQAAAVILWPVFLPIWCLVCVVVYVYTAMVHLLQRF